MVVHGKPATCGGNFGCNCRIAGVEKRLSLGTYPETSLKAAREKRDAARALIVQGIDPSDARKASKAQPPVK